MKSYLYMMKYTTKYSVRYCEQKKWSHSSMLNRFYWRGPIMLISSFIILLRDSIKVVFLESYLSYSSPLCSPSVHPPSETLHSSLFEAPLPKKPTFFWLDKLQEACQWAAPSDHILTWTQTHPLAGALMNVLFSRGYNGAVQHCLILPSGRSRYCD